MMYFSQILVLLCISIIIYLLLIIHELSHYVLATLLGNKVDEVSFGIGPKLFGFTWRETVFNFRLIFIGGYNVRTDEFNSNCNKRFAIAIIAPIINIILGIVLLYIAVGNDAFTIILLKNSKDINHYFISAFTILDSHYFHNNITNLQGLWMIMVGFAGMFSYAFGLLNMFPLPPLDGARAAFHIIENIIPLNKREVYYQNFMKYGLVFMVFLNILLIAY